MLMFLLNRNHTNGVRHFKYVSNQKVASIFGPPCRFRGCMSGRCWPNLLQEENAGWYKTTQ